MAPDFVGALRPQSSHDTMRSVDVENILLYGDTHHADIGLHRQDDVVNSADIRAARTCGTPLIGI